MELIRNGETRTAKAISPPWTLSNMKARKDGDLDFHTAPELCMDLYIYVHGLCGRKSNTEDDHGDSLSELRSCVKVEVAVLGSPSLTVRTVPVDVKQYCTNERQTIF